jgi:hypothetical protein
MSLVLRQDPTKYRYRSLHLFAAAERNAAMRILKRREITAN